MIAADGYNGVAPTDYIGGVYALDAGTGKLLWSTDAVDVIGLDAAGDVAYVGNGLKNPLTGGVTAVSARAGDPTGWIGVRRLAVQRVWVDLPRSAVRRGTQPRGSWAG